MKNMMRPPLPWEGRMAAALTFFIIRTAKQHGQRSSTHNAQHGQRDSTDSADSTHSAQHGQRDSTDSADSTDSNTTHNTDSETTRTAQTARTVQIDCFCLPSRLRAS